MAASHNFFALLCRILSAHTPSSVACSVGLLEDGKQLMHQRIDRRIGILEADLLALNLVCFDRLYLNRELYVLLKI